MENHWQKIWANRTSEALGAAPATDAPPTHTHTHARGDDEALLLALKQAAGFDVMEGGLSSEAFYGQHQHTKALCSRYHACRSVYEVGCGSGANLFLYEQEGMRCGGLDYSPALVRMARSVLRSTDLTCGEAVDLAVEPSYDICLSNSVFHYFASEEYALSVLEKMAQKASKVLALIDIHDKAKEQAFLDFRRRTIPDFETRYQGLPIRSYDRKFFETFAETHHMEILFDHYDMAGYWNNEFVFHCYLYKR